MDFLASRLFAPSRHQSNVPCPRLALVCEADELPGGSARPQRPGQLPGPGEHSLGRESCHPGRGPEADVNVRGGGRPRELRRGRGHGLAVHGRGREGVQR